MTAEIVCECGSGCEMPHKHRDIASAAPEGLPLDVERLGFDALLDIGQAILDRAYPPHPLLCSHDPRADIGARTTAAVADLIASCRRLSESGSPHPEPIYDSEGIPLPDSTWDPLRGESGSPTPPHPFVYKQQSPTHCLLFIEGGTCKLPPNDPIHAGPTPPGEER